MTVWVAGWLPISIETRIVAGRLSGRSHQDEIDVKLCAS